MFYNKKKRAQVESQFNWIFILIAGGIILLLFATFIYRYKTINDQKQQLMFSRQLDLQIATLEVSSQPSLVNRTDLPNKELKFNCQGMSGMSFGKKVVFAPLSIKPDELYVYSYPFKAGFVVTNFVYVIDPDILYVFITDENDETYRQIIKTLGIARSAVRKKVYEGFGSAMGDEDLFSKFKSIRFVFVNPTGTIDLSSYVNDNKKQHISALEIDHGGTDGNHKLTFYELDDSGNLVAGQKQETYYFDDASLLGAVVTDNKKMYDCMMASGFDRLYYLADIYYEKIVLLKDDTNLGLDCREFYKLNPGSGRVSFEDNFKLLKDDVADKFRKPDDFKSLTSNYANNFYKHVKEIEQGNEIIERDLEDCLVIY